MNKGPLRAADLIRDQRLFTETLNAFPEIVIVLTEDNRILHGNNKFVEAAGVALEDAVGKDLVEVLGYANSCRDGDSCVCIGKKGPHECRLIIRRDAKEIRRDMCAWSTRIEIQGGHYFVFVLQDIGSKKRLELLQRTFFHDILNLVTELSLNIEDLLDNLEPRSDEALKKVRDLAKAIAADIREQRNLQTAEQLHQLEVSTQEFSVEEFLEEVRELYSEMALQKKCAIVLKCCPQGENINTDKTLLMRAMGNLVKNGLEAAEGKQDVTLGYGHQNDRYVFYVHNPGFIRNDMQVQLFRRPFSTKQSGDGMGIYSVKFITENYLNGSVRFVSTPEEGTTFFIELPNRDTAPLA